jgi:hypothetical protein
MLTPVELLHVYPVCAQVLLVFIVVVVLGYRRFKDIKSGNTPVGYYKLYQNSEKVPEGQLLAARNLTNLFEIPVLFFALIPLLMITGKADYNSLVFCWIFVASRYVHSFIHLTSNKLFWRMRIYFVGILALAILWGRFFIGLI